MAQPAKSSHFSSRTFITNLLNSIPAPEAPADHASSSNTLQNTSPQAKNLLLTLHVLFPNEFLPALDLLDRGLLTRLNVQDNDNSLPQTTTAFPLPPSPHHQLSDPQDASDPPLSPPPLPLPHDDPDRPPPSRPHRHDHVFFVRSAQPPSRSSARRFQDPLATHYEVRTAAWNCSCPAFAFSAFPAGSGDGDDDDDVGDGGDVADAHAGAQLDAPAGGGDGGEGWVFGGVRKGSMAPVCKHLLACVLVERVELFRGLVEERDVSREELAGWCAGWGG